MKTLLVLGCCFVMISQGTRGAQEESGLTADEALAKLMEGNKRARTPCTPIRMLVADTSWRRPSTRLPAS